jgi:hypothetical protein
MPNPNEGNPQPLVSLRYKMTPLKAGSIFLSLVCLLAGWFLYAKIYMRTIDGEPPVKKIQFHHSWMTVYPLSNTKLEDFIDMRSFKGFGNGLTLQDMAEAGKPDNIRTEENRTYYEYWKDTGRVEVCRELTSRIKKEGVIVNWTLSAYPNNLSFFDILSPTISKYINSSSKETNLQMMTPDGKICVIVSIRGKRVEKLSWYRKFES